MTPQSGLHLEETWRDPELWGRLVESLVGAHLANAAAVGDCELFYWRDRNREVDFVVRAGRTLSALEVKTSRSRDSVAGMAAFSDAFRPKHKLLIGGDGIGVAEFLSRPVQEWARD